jgi:hypothetical protein
MNSRPYRRVHHNTHKKARPRPQSNDPVELRAADIAQRAGHHTVKSEHREDAYEEMQRTSPKTPDDEPASH